MWMFVGDLRGCWLYNMKNVNNIFSSTQLGSVTQKGSTLHGREERWYSKCPFTPQVDSSTGSREWGSGRSRGKKVKGNLPVSCRASSSQCIPGVTVAAYCQGCPCRSKWLPGPQMSWPLPSLLSHRVPSQAAPCLHQLWIFGHWLPFLLLLS